MSNSVNLSLDITKTGIQNPLIKVRQGDGGFETLHTTVTANGEPMDLQGWTITFMGTTAGNHKIVDTNVKMVEAPNGIFDYTPSKAWGMDVGEFKVAYFKFVKGDGTASSANFRVNVIEAVDLTQEEAQHYISVVDATIAEVNNHLNTVSNNLTTLGNRINDYNNKLAALQVGGRNLLLDTGRSFMGVGDNSANGNFDAQGGKYYLAGGKKVSDLYNQYGPTGYLTLSFDWVASGDTISGQFTPQWSGTPWGGLSAVSGAIKPSNTNKSGRYKSSVQLNYDGYSTGVATAVMFRQNNLQGNITISNMKLEAGNTATDWTPAPEDYLKKSNQLPAEARDFNYLATHMKKYQGTWWTGVEEILNGPTVSWTWAVVEVIPGNAETTGQITTVRQGVGAAYTSNVNGGTLGTWKPMTPSARPAMFSDLAVVAKSMNNYAGTWFATGEQDIKNGPVKMSFNSIITVVHSWNDAGLIIVSSQGYNTWIGGVASGTIKHWTLVADDANVVHKTGDTMTGNLIVPQVTATDLITGFHNVIQVPDTTTSVIDLINNDFIKGRGFWKEVTFIAYNRALSDAPTNDAYSIVKLATRGSNRTYVEYSDLSGNVWHTTASSNTLYGWVKQANDSEVVHKTGNETVAGDKTFTGKIGFSGAVANPVVSRTVSGTNGMSFKFRRTGNAVHVEISGNYTGTNWTGSSTPSYAAELFNVVVPAGFAPDDWSQSAIIEYGSAVGFGRYGYDSSSRKMTFTYRGMVGGVGSSKWIVSSVTYTTSDALPG